MVFDITQLKKIRKQLNLTQNQFAKESGVSQSLIAKIESSNLDPTYSKVKKIEVAIEKLSKIKEIKAKEIMTKNLIWIDKKEKLPKITNLMIKHSISQLPVMNNKKVIGIIYENSIIKEENLNKNTSAEQIMEDLPPIISPETGLEVIKNLLRYYNSILVKDKEDVIGIITKSDLIKNLNRA